MKFMSKIFLPLIFSSFLNSFASFDNGKIQLDENTDKINIFEHYENDPPLKIPTKQNPLLINTIESLKSNIGNVQQLIVNTQTPPNLYHSTSFNQNYPTPSSASHIQKVPFIETELECISPLSQISNNCIVPVHIIAQQSNNSQPAPVEGLPTQFSQSTVQFGNAPIPVNVQPYKMAQNKNLLDDKRKCCSTLAYLSNRFPPYTAPTTPINPNNTKSQVIYFPPNMEQSLYFPMLTQLDDHVKINLKTAEDILKNKEVFLSQFQEIYTNNKDDGVKYLVNTLTNPVNDMLKENLSYFDDKVASTLASDNDTYKKHRKFLDRWIDVVLNKPEKINVLSIDGGGVRGIVACTLLAEIEKNTDTRIQNLFSVFTGTSIGGIIAISLLLYNKNTKTFLYTPHEIMTVLKNNAQAIFKKRWYHGFTQLFRPKYKNTNLKLLLRAIIYGEDESYTKEIFEKAGLNLSIKGSKSILDRKNDIRTLYELQSIKRRLIVPVYDLISKDTIIFDSFRVNQNSTPRLIDICLATSAAPIYFASYSFHSADCDTNYNCIDGGVYLNFPGPAAASRVIDHNAQKPEIYLVSVTTGRSTPNTEDNKPKKWGALSWVSHGILDIFMDSSTRFGEDTVENCITKFIRLKVPLSLASKQMDDSSPKNLQKLENDAKQYLASNQPLLSQITTIAKSPRSDSRLSATDSNTTIRKATVSNHSREKQTMKRTKNNMVSK